MAKQKKGGREIALRQCQKNICYLCGKPFYSRRREKQEKKELWATLDHVTPVAKGGGKIANSLMAHRICNMTKGDRDPYPCEVFAAQAVWNESERLRRRHIKSMWRKHHQIVRKRA